MSAASSRTASPVDDHGSRGQPQSSLYSLIMTPINFTVFLLSLLLVDLRYTLARGRPPVGANSGLPEWLHHLLYRPRPYSHIGGGSTKGEGSSPRWHYHTKQKKLMKMQAAEAFEIRNTVLIALGIGAGLFTGTVLYLATALYGRLLSHGSML